MVREGFRRIWDWRTKVCVGREENGGIKRRRSSFTCTNIDRNVNTCSALFEGFGHAFKVAYSFPMPYLLGMGKGNVNRGGKFSLENAQSSAILGKHESKGKMVVPELEEEAVSWCGNSNLIKNIIFWTSSEIALVTPDEQGHSLLSLMCWPSKLPSVQGSCQSYT